jgi:hypothetical protein
LGACNLGDLKAISGIKGTYWLLAIKDTHEASRLEVLRRQVDVAAPTTYRRVFTFQLTTVVRLHSHTYTQVKVLEGD